MAARLHSSVRGAVLVWILASAKRGFAQYPDHPSPAAKQPATQSATVRGERLLETEWKIGLAPGISAAVSSHGRIVFSSAYGYADLDNHVSATPATIYNIGSVSKVITAIAVMQLVEQGRVRLDDEIQKYVAAFPRKQAPITVRELLTHTSGIRHYRRSDFPLAADNENWRPYTDLNDAIALFKNDSLLFAPGRYVSYSSYGINLLQGVVEKTSNMPFEEYLRRYVWGPAGMLTTQFDVPSRIVPNRARGYAMSVDGTVKNAGYGDLTYKFASGGMIASVEDLVRLGVAFNHDILIRASTRSEMVRNQTGDLLAFHPDGPATRLEWVQGLVWRIQTDSAGRRFAMHCGAVKEFSACLVDYIDDDLVAAVVANGDAGGYRFTSALAGLFRNAK